MTHCDLLLCFLVYFEEHLLEHLVKFRILSDLISLFSDTNFSVFPIHKNPSVVLSCSCGSIDLLKTSLFFFFFTFVVKARIWGHWVFNWHLYMGKYILEVKFKNKMLLFMKRLMLPHCLEKHGHTLLTILKLRQECMFSLSFTFWSKLLE